jgi:hypothetical protein
MFANGYAVQYMTELVGAVTCNGDLSGIGGLHDVVMTNLLGSGGLQVTVSSKIDPFPPMGLEPACDLHIRGIFTSTYFYSTLCLLYYPKIYFDVHA